MLTVKSTPQSQILDSVAQLATELAKGKQSGEQKGWLSLKYVKQHITERYYNKH